MSQLPIQTVISQLLSAVQQHAQVILKAPPGAGKSTYFPLQLILEQQVQGKIILLEPRRLAARNIAYYLAKQLGERVGERVGYRVKGDAKVSAKTQLEIVTEGIMTRMIQSDPELTGISLLIFDEFHERSLHADTALALSLEVQEALRDDLKIVVMSATLDQQALCKLLPDAQYIESQGRSFAVDVRYQALGRYDKLPDVMAKTIEQLLFKEQGSVLAFLPGVAAIKQVAERLQHLTDLVQICPLYGQLDNKAQQQAIHPASYGERKVVLATNIAETSLTIEGIRIVVDSGLERVARFDLATGITHLEQKRIAQSSAIQRAGRAGRIETGLCIRLYSESDYQQFATIPTPEILHSELASVCMELTYWGDCQFQTDKWLDIPTLAAIKQAQTLLQSLQLMDAQQQLTKMGKQAHELGMQPRFAAALLLAQKIQAKKQTENRQAQQGSPTILNATIAAMVLLEEPLHNQVDLADHLYSWQQGRHPKRAYMTQRAQKLMKQLKHGQVTDKLSDLFDLTTVEFDELAIGMSFAFPDRIAKQRTDNSQRFLLANGQGAEFYHERSIRNATYLVVADLMRGHDQRNYIQLAAPVALDKLRNISPDLFTEQTVVDWDEQKGRCIAEMQTCIGQLVIETQRLADPDPSLLQQALCRYIQRQGLSVLNWSDTAQSLITRIRCATTWLPEKNWPDVSDEGLLNHLDDWLVPFMHDVRSAKALKQINLYDVLMAYLAWPLNQEIDQLLPTRYQVPTGNKHAIRYQVGQAPVLSVRMQEMYGEQTSPYVANGKQAVVVELLSPARRPLQITQDLATFWQGSYKEVQKEMKGRYPKHIWPDDPANHVATTKTKRQLSHK